MDRSESLSISIHRRDVDKPRECVCVGAKVPSVSFSRERDSAHCRRYPCLEQQQSVSKSSFIFPGHSLSSSFLVTQSIIDVRRH